MAVIMKRRIELSDADYTRLAWGLGIAMDALAKTNMPIGAGQMAALWSKIEQESTLVKDDEDD